MHKTFLPARDKLIKTRNHFNVPSQAPGTILKRQWWVPLCQWGLRQGYLLLSGEEAPLVYSSGLPWEYPMAGAQASWSECQLVKAGLEWSTWEELAPRAVRRVSARHAGSSNCPGNWPVEVGQH
jgi:hypothetical protein